MDLEADVAGRIREVKVIDGWNSVHPGSDPWSDRKNGVSIPFSWHEGIASFDTLGFKRASYSAYQMKLSAVYFDSQMTLTECSTVTKPLARVVVSEKREQSC